MGDPEAGQFNCKRLLSATSVQAQTHAASINRIEPRARQPLQRGSRTDFRQA
jgi:hypothetical protein